MYAKNAMHIRLGALSSNKTQIARHLSSQKDLHLSVYTAFSRECSNLYSTDITNPSPSLGDGVENGTEPKGMVDRDKA